MIRVQFRHEWRGLVRNRLLLLLMLAVVLTGLYAIHYGKQKISAQHRTIYEIEAGYESQIEGYIATLEGDTSTAEKKYAYEEVNQPAYAIWRQTHPVFSKPSPLAALSLGQRDLNPYYNSLSGQSLYIQLFKNELSNPYKLLAGNLDLAFVFIYLFPLLIIALGYNSLSVEKEQGTYSLLRIQSRGVTGVLLAKFLFYFLLIAGLVGLLLGLAILGTDIELPRYAGEMSAWFVAVLSYCFFWLAVVGLVVAFHRSSAFNAMTCFGVWLLLLVVIPSLLTIIFARTHPIAKNHLTNLIRRTGLEETEEAMDKVLAQYYTLHPEYRPKDSITTQKLYKAYAAYTEMSDKEKKKLVDAYEAQIRRRNELVTWFNILNPAVHTQEILNALAHTDLADYLRYQQAIPVFHAQVSAFYRTRLFRNQLLTKSDYAQLPRFSMPESDPLPVRWASLLLLPGLGLLIGLLGFRMLKRSQG